MKTSEAICSSVLPEATLTRGHRRSLGIKPLTFPLVDGATAAPLFLFLFSLTLLRILLAFELKSTSSFKKKKIPQFYLLYSNAVLWPLSYQVSKADRWKELKKQIRTTPDCAAWADHYQSDAKVRKTYQMCVCVCVIRCVWNDEWRPRCGVSVCDSRCCVPVADGALGSPTAAGY